MGGQSMQLDTCDRQGNGHLCLDLTAHLPDDFVRARRHKPLLDIEHREDILRRGAGVHQHCHDRGQRLPGTLQMREQFACVLVEMRLDQDDDRHRFLQHPGRAVNHDVIGGIKPSLTRVLKPGHRAHNAPATRPCDHVDVVHLRPKPIKDLNLTCFRELLLFPGSILLFIGTLEVLLLLLPGRSRIGRPVGDCAQPSVSGAGQQPRKRETNGGRLFFRRRRRHPRCHRRHRQIRPQQACWWAHMFSPPPRAPRAAVCRRHGHEEPRWLIVRGRQRPLRPLPRRRLLHALRRDHDLHIDGRQLPKIVHRARAAAGAPRAAAPEALRPRRSRSASSS
mmetsp:Transcript_144862/g.464306  ORF Transcript_144862/g.464306 Transcript_144862/m.464306 type:complete len:335 (-) Transcript_144862:286-1290(-)